MPRIDRNRALFLGIVALQDYVDQARKCPLQSTIQLRALLALLAMHGKGETNPYRRFWAAARCPLDPSEQYEEPQHYERGTSAQTQWIRIARDLGFPAVSADFCRRVQEVLSQARDTERRRSQAPRA